MRDRDGKAIQSVASFALSTCYQDAQLEGPIGCTNRGTCLAVRPLCVLDDQYIPAQVHYHPSPADWCRMRLDLYPRRDRSTGSFDEMGSWPAACNA
jgi:hypothetical protein